MKVIHSWLKEYVGAALPDAAQVEALLTFHAFEVEGVEQVAGEEVIDIKVLPDRASDCLSHRGIARELGSILNAPLAVDPLATTITLKETKQVSVTIEDTIACPRFTAIVMTGVTVKESPDWLKRRLLALGQRPINTIVDATNYVMFALGQPMHVYDADKFPQVDGTWQFGVRLATEGETVSLLAEGGKSEDRIVTLTGTELLITEKSSNTPVGLAGIKGGRFAELTADTKNIIIEAACFNPTVIRKTARRYNILTDASKRFENGPSWELPLYAQQMIVDLILDISGGTFAGLLDVYHEKQEVVTTTVTVANVRRLLGIPFTAEAVQLLLERIGAVVTTVEDGVFTVEAPFERTDLIGEENYIDEIGRLHGLTEAPSMLPPPVPLVEINAQQYYSDRVRAALIEQGFSEVITSSFQKKGDLQLQNALASDKSFLRDSLRKNIIAVLDANFTHTDLLGITEVRVFELGTVFNKIERGIGEQMMLTLGVRTKGNGYSQKDDTIVQGCLRSVESILGAGLSWKIEKGVAELNFTARLASLPAPTAYAPWVKQPALQYQSVSSYPAISRDVALFVSNNEDVATVATVLATTAGSLLVRQTLFDTYTKDGRTSYAFRLVFQAIDRTLTDIEINKIMEEVYVSVKGRGWEVR